MQTKEMTSMDNVIEKQSNLEAENMVLGAVLLEPEIIHEITLEPEHFSIAKNQIIFKTMRELISENVAIDVVTIADKLGDRIENIGGISYLTNLAVSCPTTENVQSYEQIVFEQYKKRKLVSVAAKFLNERTDETAEEIYKTYLEIQEVGTKKERTKQDVLVEILEEMNEDKGVLTGIDTGFTDLNEMTGGLSGGDLIIIAGRPSMGKTAFALNIALNCCKNGGVVDVFSLEMPEKQIVQRMLSNFADIQGSKWRNPYRMFSDDDFKKATKAIGIFEDLDIYIHDEPKQTVTDIRAAVRKTQRKHPEQNHVVVIDYLQLITVLGRFERYDLAIGSITKELKQMARQFNVPVILLSQLSRAVEQRQDKRPMMSDLRDSGSIEQDADIIMMLYREDYYDRETQNKNIVEVNIAKHRNGPVGVIQLLFEREFSKFQNLEWRRSENNE
ncbi:replicative DNA helicase [Caldifermentibacillus hisashii]|uniref:Replicative DNA helicase n=1 Tax=Caldifermentibacillus hisashii TaxID=996558 RepID=A0ABU9K3I8_9BACI